MLYMCCTVLIPHTVLFCRHIKFSVSLVELTYQAVDTARILFEDLVEGRNEEVRKECYHSVLVCTSCAIAQFTHPERSLSSLPSFLPPFLLLSFFLHLHCFPPFPSSTSPSSPLHFPRLSLFYSLPLSSPLPPRPPPTPPPPLPFISPLCKVLLSLFSTLMFWGTTPVGSVWSYCCLISHSSGLSSPSCSELSGR